MTPLEEYHAADRAKMAERAKGGITGDAIYARASLALDAYEIQKWIIAEQEKGSKPEDVHDAFTTLIGSFVVNFITSFADPVASANHVMIGAQAVVHDCMTGKIKGVGVEINKDGTQREVTIGGAFAERIAEAGKGGWR